MKLFAVILTVASLACAVQSIAVDLGNFACPANCKSPGNELLALVKKHHPNILKELGDKFPTLPGGAITKDVLSSIGIPSIPDLFGKPNTGNVGSPNAGSPNPNTTDIKVPHVEVANPKNFTEEINKLPKIIPSEIIDQLISLKPKNITEALKIISKPLGKTFEVAGIDAPLDSKKLTRELEAVKKSGEKSNRLTLISRLLKYLKPLLRDKHRLYRIIKFFRNAIKMEPKFNNLFNQLVPSDETANVPTWPFQETIKRIHHHIPHTHLAKALFVGDCGCFDFVAADFVVKKVDIPDSSEFSQALMKLPENISSATVNKLISRKPKTLDSALKYISKNLGFAFGETDLDVPLDTDRLIADLRSAAKKNDGEINCYILISYLLKRLKSANPVKMGRVTKFFHQVVKRNVTTKGIFGRLLPFEETSKIPTWPFIDFIKELIKYNSETHLVKGLTGQAERNDDEDSPRRGGSAHSHHSKHYGHHAHHAHHEHHEHHEDHDHHEHHEHQEHHGHHSSAHEAGTTPPKKLIQPTETPLSEIPPNILWNSTQDSSLEPNLTPLLGGTGLLGGSPPNIGMNSNQPEENFLIEMAPNAADTAEVTQFDNFTQSEGNLFGPNIEIPSVAGSGSLL